MEVNNQKPVNENEIELDKYNVNELKIIDNNNQKILETNNNLNIEILASNNNENNEEIIIVQDDSQVIDKKEKGSTMREINLFEVKNQNEVSNNNKQQDNNKSLQPRNEIRNPDRKISSKHDQVNFFFEDIYKDILFFFINPIAGSHDGQLLIDMGVKKVEFLDIVNSSGSSAYIFNILDQTNYLQGIALLNDYQERVPRSLPKVIIGGGDGTLLKVIEKLQQEKINIQNCIFGLLPLGNNNTLSSSLGWGDNIGVNSDMSKFKLIVKDLLEASSTFVDVWTISLKKDGGEIIQINNSVHGLNNKIVKLDKLEVNKQTSLKSSFINYFSIGQDARIGFGFEKSRTTARCCNKCIHFWETCKKTCCRKTIKLNGFIESLNIIKINDLNHNLSQITEIENRAHLTEIFRSKEVSPVNPNESSQKKYETVVLKGDPVTLICQNINYYIGNKKDIWKKSSSMGIEHNNKSALTKEEIKEKEEIEKKEFKEVMEGDQSINDGKLEFITFQSGTTYNIESLISGFADKVYHGRGPVLIKFKDTPIKTDLDKENRVYLNIDGDYYHIVKPEEIRVRPNKNIQSGKLRFLCKKRE